MKLCSFLILAVALVQAATAASVNKDKDAEVKVFSSDLDDAFKVTLPRSAILAENKDSTHKDAAHQGHEEDVNVIDNIPVLNTFKTFSVDKLEEHIPVAVVQEHAADVAEDHAAPIAAEKVDHSQVAQTVEAGIVPEVAVAQEAVAAVADAHKSEAPVEAVHLPAAVQEVVAHGADAQVSVAHDAPKPAVHVAVEHQVAAFAAVAHDSVKPVVFSQKAEAHVGAILESEASAAVHQEEAAALPNCPDNEGHVADEKVAEAADNKEEKKDGVPVTQHENNNIKHNVDDTFVAEKDHSAIDGHFQKDVVVEKEEKDADKKQEVKIDEIVHVDGDDKKEVVQNNKFVEKDHSVKEDGLVKEDVAVQHVDEKKDVVKNVEEQKDESKVGEENKETDYVEVNKDHDSDKKDDVAHVSHFVKKEQVVKREDHEQAEKDAAVKTEEALSANVDAVVDKKEEAAPVIVDGTVVKQDEVPTIQVHEVFINKDKPVKKNKPIKVYNKKNGQTDKEEVSKKEETAQHVIKKDEDVEDSQNGQQHVPNKKFVNVHGNRYAEKEDDNVHEHQVAKKPLNPENIDVPKKEEAVEHNNDADKKVHSQETIVFNDEVPKKENEEYADNHPIKPVEKDSDEKIVRPDKGHAKQGEETVEEASGDNNNDEAPINPIQQVLQTAGQNLANFTSNLVSIVRPNASAPLFPPIFQNIQNALRPTPASDSVDGAPSTPPIIQGLQNIQNTIQSSASSLAENFQGFLQGLFNRPSSDSVDNASTSPNIIVQGIQNFQQNVGQTLQNLNNTLQNAVRPQSDDAGEGPPPNIIQQALQGISNGLQDGVQNLNNTFQSIVNPQSDSPRPTILQSIQNTFQNLFGGNRNASQENESPENETAENESSENEVRQKAVKKFQQELQSLNRTLQEEVAKITRDIEGVKHPESPVEAPASHSNFAEKPLDNPVRRIAAVKKPHFE